jgi:hypothetical protein
MKSPLMVLLRNNSTINASKVMSRWGVWILKRKDVPCFFVIRQTAFVLQTLEIYLGSTFGSFFGDGYRSTSFGSQYRSNRRRGNRRFLKKNLFFSKRATAKCRAIANTLDPRMLQLPHVKEYQEEAVWQVFQDRCQGLIVEDQEKVASCAVVAPRVEPSTVPTNPRELLGCTKQPKMMAPSASVGRKVAVDATRVAEEVSPAKMSILLLYM